MAQQWRLIADAGGLNSYSSMARPAVRRTTPKVRSLCVNCARRDLCGGRSAMGVPTANAARPAGPTPAAAALGAALGIPSLEFVPNTTPAALLIQMTVLDQVAEMLLQRVSADARQFDRIANRDAPVLAGKFDDLQ